MRIARFLFPLTVALAAAACARQQAAYYVTDPQTGQPVPVVQQYSGPEQYVQAQQYGQPQYAQPAQPQYAQSGNRDDVNINVIHPGSTQTERNEQLTQQFAKAQGKTVEQVRAEALSKSGLRRIAQPEDVAALAVFLCRVESRHIQGTAIAVDGGGTPGYY